MGLALTDGTAKFIRDRWPRIPLKLKQKFWAETDYAVNEPTAALIAEIEKATTLTVR
jgi:hypothetical protein